MYFLAPVSSRTVDVAEHAKCKAFVIELFSAIFSIVSALFFFRCTGRNMALHFLCCAADFFATSLHRDVAKLIGDALAGGVTQDQQLIKVFFILTMRFFTLFFK